MYIKRTVKILSFLLGLLLLICATSALFIPKNNSKEAGMEEHLANGVLGEATNTVDVIILGDSEAYSSFSPMQIWQNTGYTSYVCSSPVQTLDYTLTLLQRAFEKQKPKIVFLETLAVIRTVHKSSVFESELAKIFPVFTYHNRWKSLQANDWFTSPEYTWTDYKKGYRYYPKVDGTDNTDYMQPTTAAADLSSVNVDLVKDIYELCEANGTKLVLISSPSKKNWNYKRHNAIESLAKEIGCEYIDMNLENDTIGIDWTKDTRDKGDHINHSGAVKATKYLSDYLVKTGLLTDHRNDEAYKSWDDALEKYLKETSTK